jgi:aryl-alcohol dehydrogenase-like predicted oxidoreductase
MWKRKLGNSDLELSAISLGCWFAGVDWWGHFTDEQALGLLRHAYERGITFFDNGDAYGNGRAETLLGKFLKSVPRPKVQIGGKFGYDFYSDPGAPGSHRERKQDFSPKFMRFALEKSLARLGTDHIDLYMAHNIKLPQFNDDLFDELEKAKQEGKIRQWGVSLGPAIGWREEGFEALLNRKAKGVQTVFNLFERHPGQELSEAALSAGGGVLARVHDNSSILKDIVKLDTAIGASDHRKFRDLNWKLYGLKKVEIIRPIAEKYAMTIHQLACKWLLQQQRMTSITATLLNESEINEAADAVEKPDLSREDLNWLDDQYAMDFGLGDEAHPCDLKSSKTESGIAPSKYEAPPIYIA